MADSHQPHTTDPHATPPGEEADYAHAGGVKAGTVAMIGAVGVILTVTIIIACQAWFYGLREARLRQTQWQKPDSNVAAYMDEQRKKLNTVRWTDREAGMAAIPIGRAMEITAEEGLQSAE